MEQCTITKARNTFADSCYYPIEHVVGCYRLIAATYKNTKFNKNCFLISGIEKILCSLKPLYSQVVHLRFWRSYKQNETATALSLSPERIRQIEKKFLT